MHLYISGILQEGPPPPLLAILEYTSLLEYICSCVGGDRCDRRGVPPPSSHPGVYQPPQHRVRPAGDCQHGKCSDKYRTHCDGSFVKQV